MVVGVVVKSGGGCCLTVNSVDIRELRGSVGVVDSVCGQTRTSPNEGKAVAEGCALHCHSLHRHAAGAPATGTARLADGPWRVMKKGRDVDVRVAG